MVLTPEPFTQSTTTFTTAARANTAAEFEGPYNEGLLFHQNGPAPAGPYNEQFLAQNRNTVPVNPVPPSFDIAPPCADVDRITPEDFRVLTGIRPVGQGKSMAMFVRCNKGTFFMKCDEDCQSELAAAELFRTLPVNVPKIKIIEGEEANRVINALKDQRYTNPNCAILANLLATSRQCMLQEVLKGDNLQSNLISISTALSGIGGRTRLFIMGMMLAYDLVIENCDRFPSVISKHDNFGNLMLTRMGVTSEGETGTSRPTAIDQKVSDFSREHLDNQNLEKFQTDTFLIHAVRSPLVRKHLADALVTCLQNKNITLHQDANVAVKDGITEGLMKLASGNQATLKELKNRLYGFTDVRVRQQNILDQAIKVLAARKFIIDKSGKIAIR